MIYAMNGISQDQPITLGNKTTELSQDDFLQLLAVQMENQNPLSPMDDTTFIAQLAQFNALQQMQNMNSSFDIARAISMIGKSVYATVPSDSGELQEINGIADSIKIHDGKAFLIVNGVEVSLEHIEEIRDNNGQ